MHQNAVNGIDAIAVTKSTARRRRMIKGRGDIGFDFVADRVILNRRANAEVFTALIRLQIFELFPIEIA